MPGATGAAIGTYRLLEKLGEGGMGTVWVAEHTLLGRRAAIKLLHETYSTSEALVQRFFNEAKVIAAISDPGIVQIFDFGVHTDGAPYIVMELLEGEPLDARLRRIERLWPGDAVRLMKQVALSLSAAHAKGVVHRDLKPENLFVARDPAVPGGERVKVLDFGIAKLARTTGKHKTRTGAVVGTPAYMSPEQCRAIEQIDHRADIYSLGAVLFCLVTGRPPFVGEGAGDVIVSHVRDQPPVPSSVATRIPVALDSVILRCLEKDPARRYQSMEELATALEVLEALPRDRAATIGGGRNATVGAGAASELASPSLAVTTVSDASGEVSRRRRGVPWRWIGLGGGAAGAVGVAIAIALGGDGEPPVMEPAPAAAPDTAPEPAGAPVLREPAGEGAGVPETAAPAETAAPVVPVDAAISADAEAVAVPADAAPAAPVPVDAAVVAGPAEPAQARGPAAGPGAPRPPPRTGPVQRPVIKPRDKEVSPRHGTDTKGPRSGRIDRGD